jgi:hypothetical protein
MQIPDPPAKFLIFCLPSGARQLRAKGQHANAGTRNPRFHPTTTVLTSPETVADQ